MSFQPTALIETGETYPSMFYYRLCLHKDGKVLMNMELNVPLECFDGIRLNTFRSLEEMLLQYGKENGFSQSLPQAALE